MPDRGGDTRKNLVAVERIFISFFHPYLFLLDGSNSRDGRSKVFAARSAVDC